jgi:hypothetical protein
MPHYMFCPQKNDILDFQNQRYINSCNTTAKGSTEIRQNFQLVC